MDNPSAMIWGVTGQDGSYLSEFLLEKGYEVIGVARRVSTDNTQRLSSIIDNGRFILEEGDITDPSGVTRLVSKYAPTELYNLAAQSHVATSFEQPSTTTQIGYIGHLNILEAVRNTSNFTKVYHASSSEMFGSSYSLNSSGSRYQDEDTPLAPNSPYSIAKTAAHHLGRVYRKSYGLYVSNGILYNHESPRRGDKFVTRKITKYLADLCVNGFTKKLELGNLESYRDWTFAGDVVSAMWNMLQLSKPDDFIICSGESHSVQEFLECAFEYLHFDWKNYIEIQPKLYRPYEVPYLRGCSNKAYRTFSWKPTVDFKHLVHLMIEADINETKKKSSST